MQPHHHPYQDYHVGRIAFFGGAVHEIAMKLLAIDTRVPEIRIQRTGSCAHLFHPFPKLVTGFTTGFFNVYDKPVEKKIEQV